MKKFLKSKTDDFYVITDVEEEESNENNENEKEKNNNILDGYKLTLQSKTIKENEKKITVKIFNY
jgi:hypothetical protein